MLVDVVKIDCLDWNSWVEQTPEQACDQERMEEAQRVEHTADLPELCVRR